MDYNILHTFFLNNPDLFREIDTFCKGIPEYNCARREYRQAAQELQQILGFERYCQYEERINHYQAIESKAYYLFGLGLRKELLQALGPSL